VNLFRLDGQKALVTGGTGGLGEAMADALHEAGATVAVAGTSARVHEIAARLGGPGFQADLSDRDAPAVLFADAVKQLGQIDILVTAHGMITRHPAEDYPLDEWERTLAINLTSVFSLCQLAGRHMLPRRQGKIINLSSELAFSGGVRVPAYTASKGGVAQLTKGLANEWAGRGVNVNAIAPGYMDTPMTVDLVRDAARSQQILARIPAGRWGRPADLQGAVVFLASAASDYVHGVVLPIDGGWLSR
jgi:2-deoxy-D-gluconate 3-dehydrogenase